MKLKKILATVLPLMLSISMSACNAQNDSPAPESNTPDDQAETASTAEMVVVGIPVDIGTFNPLGSRNEASNILLPALYETMGAYDSFGGTFHGVLMESWTQVDERTFECKLYDNIYDHDGNHLTAEDVVFSCEKTWEIGELPETQVIESVTAVDPYTVRYVWGSTPGIGSFEGLMSSMYIVTKAGYEAHDGMTVSPCGTGPYKYLDYVVGESASIEATGNYWQDADKIAVPTQLSNVKVIKCQVIAEPAQVATALQTNRIDVSSKVGSEDLPMFAEGGQYSTGHKVFSYPRSSGDSLMLNMSPEGHLSDLNLRLAILYAIDQDGVRAFVNGGNNIPLGAFGGTTYSDYDESWLAGNFPYDPDKAADYLSRSNYNGETLKIILNAGGAAKEEEALAIKQYLDQIGIKLELETMPIPQLLSSQGDPTKWDFMLADFANTTGYIVNSWSKYFDKNTIGRETTKNFIDDPELQQLMETVLSIEGHTPENMNKVMDYMHENGVYKSICVIYDNVCYNSDLIGEVVLDQFNYLCPGAFTYK